MNIKFRAWHKQHKKMFNVLTIGWAFGAIEYVQPTYDYMDCDGFGSEDIELMQCTGLQDKNGKDIYEGDIIKTEWGDYTSGAHIDTLRDFYHSHIEFGWDAENMEVLGNIYENPEHWEQHEY